MYSECGRGESFWGLGIIGSMEVVNNDSPDPKSNTIALSWEGRSELPAFGESCREAAAANLDHVSLLNMHVQISFSVSKNG